MPKRRSTGGVVRTTRHQNLVVSLLAERKNFPREQRNCKPNYRPKETG